MDPFLGMICIFGFNFPPRGWAFCQGQLLSIAQNTALFSLLGTTYGGNGQTTFALPDLRGRVPLGQGQGPGLPNYTLGEIAGSTTTTLLTTNMPQHIHQVSLSIPVASTAGTEAAPANGLSTLAAAVDGSGLEVMTYTQATADRTLKPFVANTGIAGGSQPFNNMQPYLAVNYCIAMQGIFPSRN
ncbi:MAG: tail fiber protein [Bacteroidetes bacterium]|uniref:phage tail protein n=1 Tax=Phnomibacter sp. TaxID=2836217 RepID=UPI002FDDB778|nr:tail fiber protein [Bacteroidota bacterium]